MISQILVDIESSDEEGGEKSEEGYSNGASSIYEPLMNKAKISSPIKEHVKSDVAKVAIQEGDKYFREIKENLREKEEKSDEEGDFPLDTMVDDRVVIS